MIPDVLARVQAELDRTRVTVGETVTLTLRTDNPRQKLTPDLGPLEADFLVLDQRSETQLSIVNNQQTALVRMLVTLEPKRAGNLQIPSFTIDQDRTQPISLTVVEAPQLAPGELPPVFLEVEILPEDGPYYVHGQLGLLVRIFYLPDTTDAAISPPEPSPASARLLQETPYQAERGGERYRVLERHYAVFPERSGEMVIPPMRLTGRLVERNNSAVWQPRVRGRRIQAASDEIRLQIEPRPDGFSGSDWLPARNLQLSQRISTVDSLRVGEPVTRTVIVEAMGLEENMLVEPVWPDIEGARIYPDQPQGITRDDGQWVLGHKEFRYAVVPEEEGELVLPELTLYWWDIVNNEQRQAVLPEQRIVVEPSALVPEAPVLTPVTPALPMEQQPMTVRGGKAGYWPWLALVFAILWLLTLGLALRWRGQMPAMSANQPASREGPGQVQLAELEKACRGQDASRARLLLKRWLQQTGRSDSALEFAAHCGDEGLQQAIYALDASGFSPQSDSNWSGSELMSCLKAWLQKEMQADHSNPPSPTDIYAAGR